MTILSALHSSRIRNRSMGVLHLIAADESCEVSDILDLLSRPVPPKLPAASTPAAAPAVVKAEVVTPASSATPSSEHREQLDGTGCTDLADHGSSARGGPDGVSLSTAADLVTGPTGDEIKPGKSVEPSGSAAPSREDQMRALFADGKRPTAKEAYVALGYSGNGPANRLAAKLGLTFRKVSKEELRANGLAARAKEVRRQRAKQDATTEALKAAPEKPQEPVERAGPPTPRSEALPPTERAAPVAARKVKAAPTGRFYLRDKDGLYVHQSLQKDPNADGPLMTLDRKWAWFDTMERYRGAKKFWPELATMRKEGAQ